MNMNKKTLCRSFSSENPAIRLKAKPVFSLFTALFLFSLGGAFCFFPEICASGAKNGLETCLQILIPSLFPFMVLGSLIARSGAASCLGRLVEKPFRLLFGLPGSAASALFLSMVGGYPVGARSVDALVESGALTEAEGKRMLCFCVNAGPAFLISVVGAAYLGSPQAGILLLTGQLSACLLLGLLSRKKPAVSRLSAPSSSQRASTPIGDALVLSVWDAIRSMAGTCGFVVLMATLSEFMFSFLPEGDLSLWAAALGEVTQGCRLLAENGVPLWCLSFVIGWGGFSVHFQIFSQLRHVSLNRKKFFLFRGLHGVLSAAITFLLEQSGWFPGEISEVFSSFTPSSPSAFSSVPSLSGSAALIFTCVLFLIGLFQPAIPTKPGFFRQMGWGRRNR